MKCIKSEEGVVNRIHDAQAEVRVKSGFWSYVPKSDWKSYVRFEKTQENRLESPDGIQEDKVIKRKKPPKTSKQKK